MAHNCLKPQLRESDALFPPPWALAPVTVTHTDVYALIKLIPSCKVRHYLPVNCDKVYSLELSEDNTRIGTYSI